MSSGFATAFISWPNPAGAQRTSTDMRTWSSPAAAITSSVARPSQLFASTTASEAFADLISPAHRSQSYECHEVSMCCGAGTGMHEANLFSLVQHRGIERTQNGHGEHRCICLALRCGSAYAQHAYCSAHAPMPCAQRLPRKRCLRAGLAMFMRVATSSAYPCQII